MGKANSLHLRGARAADLQLREEGVSWELESWPLRQALPVLLLTFRMSNSVPAASLLSAKPCAKCLLWPKLT